jgi:hypothetical protein
VARQVRGGAGSGRRPYFQSSFEGRTQAFDSSVDGGAGMRSCARHADHPGLFEINGDTTLEPLAAGIAVDSFDKDSNALDVPRVARHDSEHSIFRIRARLRADSVLVTGHHDACHICQERQGRRQAPMPRRH